MFHYIISLGFFCGVAASMDRYGLRSCSGPFDWCFSGFDGVIQTIEERFEHFFEYQNLEAVPAKPREIKDIRYHFHFLHDIQNSAFLMLEYPAVKEKYARRNEHFLLMLEKPCCCIRAIQNAEEIDFINTHQKEIKLLFKQFNPENEVIFLIPADLKGIPISFTSFYYVNNYDGDTKEALTRTFDSNPELLSWLLANSDPEQIKLNLARKKRAV
ncbi:MAG: hypothetical protein E7256_08275 [Lachnospiraceae bacterium]|nr:hypothetical protein [Lachnospiraceae bacterium]